MTITTMNLPTSFLPNLPRQSLNTLDPLSPTEISTHIARLRTLLVPGIHGVSTTTTTHKNKPNAEPSTSLNQPSHHRTSSNISTTSTTSTTSTSTTSTSVVSEHPGLDEFERDWAEKWLHGLITRGEGWLAEVEPYESEVGSSSARAEDDDDRNHGGTEQLERYQEEEDEEEMTDEQKEEWREYHEREAVLKDASALISSLAGCAAGGGITRDLVFPLNLAFPSSSLSTITNNPLSSSSSSGVPSSTSTDSITLKIYDAALSDHTSVGVQTWGSAILLGRIFALDPWRWLFNHLGTEEMKVAAAADIPGASVGGLEGDRTEVIRGPRVLELGAGTGVMAILIRRILDEIKRCDSSSSPDDSDQGSLVGTISRQPVRLVGDEVLATDYHPLVLDNLEKCIRLNFSPSVADQGEEAAVGVPGLETMLLDWSTFPGIVRRWAEGSFFDGMKQQGLEPKDGPSGDWTLPTSLVTPGDVESETPLLTDQVKDVLDTTWDLIIAADCVYDLSHAEMIRDVVKWTLRLPEVDETGEIIRPGGVLHLLSPIRPTYAAETASIIEAFPSSSILPERSERIRLAKMDQEAYEDDNDRDVNSDGPVSVNALSARLARFGSKQDLSSGRNSPSSMRHVPSTNNSSGQATPRLRTNRSAASMTTRNEASTTTVDIGGFPRCKSGPNGSALGGQGDEDEDEDDDEVDPVLEKLEREAVIQRTLARDMGRGRDGRWVLATTQRRELERMQGSGRSDEVEYWWWEIRWC